MVGDAVASEWVGAAETSRLMVSMLTVAETGEVGSAATPTAGPDAPQGPLAGGWGEVVLGAWTATDGGAAGAQARRLGGGGGGLRRAGGRRRRGCPRSGGQRGGGGRATPGGG